MDYESSVDRAGTTAPIETGSPLRSRGSAGLAWCVILLMIAGIILPRNLSRDSKPVDPPIAVFEIQARYLVGVSGISHESADQIELQINAIYAQGSTRQRLMGAALYSELLGPERASLALDEIQQHIDDGTLVSSDADQEALNQLTSIQSTLLQHKQLTEEFSPETFQEARDLLMRQLGWVGKLAMAPPGTTDRPEREKLLMDARRTVFVGIGTLLQAAQLAAIGFVIQLVWWVFAATGKLSSDIGPLRGVSAIYAETFALWMAIFVGLSYAMLVLPWPIPGMGWLILPQIVSLTALFWPVIRGIRWRDVRTDTGLKFQPQGWLTPIVGIGTYLSALPVLGIAMVVTWIMMAVASRMAGVGQDAVAPVHPIAEHILRGSWPIRLQLMLVAIFASIPEEIMFRGVLYRHLREAGSKLGYVGQVAFASLVSSFIFAVIHPQGLLGIPILMGLAMVFALVREWRGSIIPCIIAHAMVNGGTTLLLLLMAD